jgi:very-short-patch-repair endonuclease
MDHVLVDGLRVTTPERTLLDCCSVLPALIVAKALESAIRKRLTTEERIYATLVEKGGRGVKGSKKLRWILAERISDTTTASGSESELLYHMRMALLPLPILEQEFFSADGQRMVPDFYWPNRHKAVEVDGLDAHDSADKLDRDLKRQNALMDLGIELRRFSAREVRRNPQGVVGQIRQFLQACVLL